MPPNAPTRPALRSRYEGRREQVIQEAARLFAERGYDGTGLEDLSEATGLAIGGIYHYIGGKQDLLSAMFDQLMDPILATAEEIEQRDGPARDRLRELVRAWVAHVADHRDHMLVFSQERHAIEQDPGRWSEIRHSRREFEEVLHRLLSEIGQDPDRTRVAHFGLLGMVNHSPHWLKSRDRASVDEIADGFWRMALAGL